MGGTNPATPWCVLDPRLPKLTEKEGVRPRAFGGHSVQLRGQVKLASSSGPAEPRVFQFLCRSAIHLLWGSSLHFQRKE